MRESSQPLNIRYIATSFPNHVPVTCQYAMILTNGSLANRPSKPDRKIAFQKLHIKMWKLRRSPTTKGRPLEKAGPL
jgi:hypothetical protein